MRAIDSIALYLATGLLSSWAHAAHAQVISVSHADANLHVVWNAPSQCGDANQVLLRIENEVHDVIAQFAPMNVVASVTTNDSRLHLVLRFDDDNTTRELDVENCARAVETAAVLVALALEERIAESRAQGENSADPNDLLHAERHNTQAARIVERDAQDSASPSVAVHAGALLSSGAAPRPSIGFGAGLRFSFASFAVEIAYQRFLPSLDVLDAESGAAARYARQVGALRLGYEVEWGRVTFTPQVGFAIGDLLGEGVRVANAASIHRLWMAPLLGIAVRLSLAGTFSLFARLDLELPLTRTVFAIRGAREVFQVNTVVTDLAVGLEWNIL